MIINKVEDVNEIMVQSSINSKKYKGQIIVNEVTKDYYFSDGLTFWEIPEQLYFEIRHRGSDE